MLNKIEHKTRNVSHVEVRELARVYKMTVAEIDAMATELEAGRRQLPAAPVRPKRTSKKR
jgi:hypothetical protein